MKSKLNPSMPQIGSRAHRILVELARHPNPVPEAALMAAHGLDDLHQTQWRQGPYKQLACQGLIVLLNGAWRLTEVGRQLMDQVEAEMLGQAQAEAPAAAPVAPAVPPEQPAEQPAAEPATPPGFATSRAPAPFKPLVRQKMQRPIRQGAYDYRDIPSLVTGDAAAKEPS